MTKKVARVSKRLWRDEHGQDLAEYGIALAVISGVVGLIAIFVGFTTLGLWETAETSISNAVGS
jgi:Flp pilus assembly pilin Flp